MLRDSKNEALILAALTDYKRRHDRMPSIRELADYLGWKKSITHRNVAKLINKGKLKADFENDRIISKSLQLVS